MIVARSSPSGQAQLITRQAASEPLGSGTVIARNRWRSEAQQPAWPQTTNRTGSRPWSVAEQAAHASASRRIARLFAVHVPLTGAALTIHVDIRRAGRLP